MARKSRYTSMISPAKLERLVYQAGQYGRLSVEDGDDIQRNSIGNQRKIATHFVMGRDDIEIVEHYFDNGYSGMNYDRPDFQRMMEDVENGRINCIIVKDISRFGRHFISTSEYVERILPNKSVRLICINDNYDSADECADVSTLMLPLKMVMNDSYVRDISRKIRSGISAKMNSGEYLPSASSVPYGYIRDPEQATYRIDSEAAKIVQRIFLMRADGRAFNDIARELNGDGVLSPGKLRYIRGVTKAEKYADALWVRGTIRKITKDFNDIARELNGDGVLSPGKLRYIRGVTKAEKYADALWVRGTIRKITKDRVYLGHRIHGKVKCDKLGEEKMRRPEEEWQTIENAHPPIISQALFEKVQRVNLEELNKRDGYEKRNDVVVDHRELFRGKVVCGECGHPLAASKGCARPHAKSGSRVFFDCAAYQTSNHMRCSSHYIRQETLMRAVRQTLDQQVKIAVDLERLLREIRHMPQTSNHMRCSSHYIRQETLMRAVRQTLDQQVKIAVDLERLLREIRHMPGVKAARSSQNRILTSLRVKRQNMEGKLEQLLHDLATGLITRDEYEYAKKLYTCQHEQFQKEEIAAREVIKEADNHLKDAEQWIAEMKRYQALPEIDRPMLDLLVKRILVFQDRSIKIELNYADPYEPLRTYMGKQPEVCDAV